MNVRQMIAALQKIEDKEQQVEIAIRQYNQAYPVAYTPIMVNAVDADNADFGGAHGMIRIYTNLPSDDKSFMYTGTRKI